MSRRRNKGRRPVGKAITPTSVARQGGRVRDVSTDVEVMTTGAGSSDVPPLARLMPSPPGWATMPFAPGRPLDPVPINPPRPDSGRPEPRLYEFPISWNLSTSPQRLVPWAILRSAADGVSMFRRCIEVRKDHMRGLDWDIVIGQDALDAAQRKADRAERAAKHNAPPKSPADQATTSPAPPAGPAGVGGTGPAGAVAPAANPEVVPSSSGAPVQPGQPQPPPVSDSGDAPDQGTPATGRAAVEDEMRDRLAPAIDAAKKFMRVPDRGKGVSFETWLGTLLEEVFVLDALAIYPRYTLGGDLYSLEIVDGSTIKPLLDERGGRPLPPFPAYQQILWGFPRGDFQATTSETTGPNGQDEEVIEGGYPSDQMIYFKRVDRVWSPYGLSAVEQALDDGSLYLKRHRWMMAEYTEGTSVSGLFTSAEITNMSPEQLLEFEVAFNRLYQGSIGERHSARFLPPGIMPIDPGGATGSDAIAEKYKPEYDLYLLKLMVSHFDTTLPEIGFTDAAAGGLGASGYHEGQENVQMRKRLPIIKFVESLITSILHDHFGSPDELEFKFLGLDDQDEPGASDVDDKLLGGGVITLNERRDKLGLSRYEFPEADMAMVSTGRGVIYLEGSSATAPPGEMIAPAAPVATAVPGAPASSPPPGGPGPVAPAQPGTAPQATPPANAAKAAEADAYRRWVRKGARGRPFRWEHHDGAEAAELVKAGGAADPKAPWPGWSRDLQVAQHYEPALTRALTGAVGVPTLSARWTEHGGTADVGVARAWLGHDLALRIAAALAVPLHRVWTEGWYVGDVSAGFMLAQLGPRVVRKAAGDGGTFDHETDWGAWTPGDARAARAILEGSGRYPGLEAMLASGDVTIRSIAEHRVDELARVLSQAASEGWGNGKTAAAIRELLTDPRWARMVAITEVSRASSASSMSRYRDNGVDAKSWMTAADQRVCPECSEDEQQGDIPIGDYFQDGSDAPPGHPICRCSIAPGWLPEGAARGAGVGGPGLGDLAGLSEEDVALGLADEEGVALGEAADEWAAEVEEILSEVEAGVTEGPDLGGSTGANVHRVETDAGRVLVSKTPVDPYAGADETENAAHQIDAEVLGAQVARAVGLDAPVVAERDGELLMTFMDGRIAQDVPNAVLAAVEEGNPGLLMRLVDLLISNKDRNLGNFVLDQDRIGLFDHGLAFLRWSDAGEVPAWREDKLLGWATRDGWVANRLTGRDVATLRERLGRLERTFTARSRRDWFEAMMARLDAIAEHAGGTEDLL